MRISLKQQYYCYYNFVNYYWIAITPTTKVKFVALIGSNHESLTGYPSLELWSELHVNIIVLSKQWLLVEGGDTI